MTLVLNRQRRLSGSNILLNRLFYIGFILLFGIVSCTPKVGVLRSPDHSAGEATKGTTDSKVSPIDEDKHKLAYHDIALLLPFQLDLIKSSAVQKQDITRSALALDFYQGFEMGLNELAKKGGNFSLDVLDTRDNTNVVTQLASTSKVNSASLIVGPVFPKEIKSFGANYSNKNVLQINPLAATKPSEFNIPNLVSITPPITAHEQAIVEKLVKDYRSDDVVIIYNTSDSDSKQFLSGMAGKIKAMKSSIKVVSVSNLEDLNSQLRMYSSNFIVAGTTSRQELNTLIINLTAQYLENYYTIKLFGHPLWNRFDFSMYSEFPNFSPVITTDSNMNPWKEPVRRFKDTYANTFGVEPSDASFKGYDAAQYFGNLVYKYDPENIRERLTKGSHQGLYSAYKFNYNSMWGYVNEAVFYKIYRGGTFELL